MVLALTATQWVAYRAALDDHSMHRMDFHVLDLSGNFLRSFHPIALSGSVSTTASGEGCNRTMTASFLDPDHALGFDSARASDGLAGINRYLQPVHSVWVPDMGRWVSTEVFTGQPFTVERVGDLIQVECRDKWARHDRGVLPSKIGKGVYIVDAIRTLAHLAGEDQFNLPSRSSVPSKLKSPLAFGGPDDALSPGALMRRLARGVGWQIFYAADGTLTMRKPPLSPSMTWQQTEIRRGNSVQHANILDDPQRRTDYSSMRNSIRAVGNKKITVRAKGRKKATTKEVGIVGYASLPASHAFSASRMAANGRPWEARGFVEASVVTTQAALNAMARQQLTDQSTEVVESTYTALPAYHLEPGDLGVANIDNEERYLRLGTFETPLFPNDGEGMTIGWTSRFANAPLLQRR